jgi:hypothetical protein
MKANAATIVVTFFLGMTIINVMSVSASAQSQIQGMTAGSPGPPGGSGNKTPHDDCTAQAKDKKLAGRARRAFVKECETKK